ncbi:AMP-binding protein, partial [bacterium]|nr:AMP-binding protein [bacterium]
KGRPGVGVDRKLGEEDQTELPWAVKAFGSRKVRGPLGCSGYYTMDGSKSHDDDGWFDTGDVATMDEYATMQITDRAKDVIKSGGEWISSIEVENVAQSHPDVTEAAVIGMPHPKWAERPLLVVVPAEGKSPSKDELLGYFEGKIAKWWTPDDVQFVEEIPHTATGKISKLELRKSFEDYKFPEAD